MLFRGMVFARFVNSIIKGGYVVFPEKTKIRVGGGAMGLHLKNRPKVIRRIFVLLFCMVMIPSFAVSATYYVRPDGGTYDQCTGLVDAAYAGVGTNQPCAWSHPFWAIDGNDPPSWMIQGGGYADHTCRKLSHGHWGAKYRLV